MVRERLDDENDSRMNTSSIEAQAMNENVGMANMKVIP